MAGPTPNRAAKWLVASMTGAAVSTAACLYVLAVDNSTSPNSLVFGEPLFYTFIDPFVLTFAVPAGAGSGLAAYLLAYFWLDDTVIWKTTTLTTAAVVAEVLVVARHDPFEALIYGYPVLLAAAALSKRLFRHEAA